MSWAPESSAAPPEFADPGPLIARLARRLVPPEPLSVSEAAEKFRGVRGGQAVEPFTFDRTPYLREPADRLGSGQVELVGVIGPAQSGKSEIGLCWLTHGVVVDPADLMWIGPTKELVGDFVKRRVAHLVGTTSALVERMRGNTWSDNLFYKEFDSESWTFAWPVGAQLRARPVPRFVADDYDDIPPDIDGQGDVITLLEARQTTFEGRDVGLVMSSPSMGKGKGIEAIYESGSRKAWHWPCPQCGAWFAPDLRLHLKFDRTRDVEDARRSAVVVCPANGCVIEPAQKRAMNARGVWLEPHQAVAPDGAIVGAPSGRRRETYRIDGLMGMASWGKLAAKWREAELDFERQQDERKLRAFMNTRAGYNYTSQLGDMEPLAAGELAQRREWYDLGTVPAGVICLTAAVDVQGNRFEVMVTGWGLHFESWIVDRFALHQLDDRRTDLRPASHLEHWEPLLAHVLQRRWTLAADATRSVPLLNVAIDTGGLPGVSTHASQFWRLARRRGVPDRQIMLVKGGINARTRLVPPPSRLDATGKGDKVARKSAKLFVLNVDGLKDIVAVRLRRGEPGPGYVHLPAGFDDRYVEELVAEEKTDEGWTKTGPNETWDLAVYNLAAMIRWAGERGDMSLVPAWARVPRVAPAPQAPGAPTAEPAVEDGQTRRMAPVRRPRARAGGFVYGWRR